MTIKIPDSTHDLFGRPILCGLSTINPNGQPHTVPVWCDYDGTYVRVNCPSASRKARKAGGFRSSEIWAWSTVNTAGARVTASRASPQRHRRLFPTGNNAHGTAPMPCPGSRAGTSSGFNRTGGPALTVDHAENFRMARTREFTGLGAVAARPGSALPDFSGRCILVRKIVGDRHETT